MSNKAKPMPDQPLRTTRCKCEICKGYGVAFAMKLENCGLCHGSGWNNSVDMWYEPCIGCRGAGEFDQRHLESCKHCNGTGYM